MDKIFYYHFRYVIADDMAKQEKKLRFNLCFEPQSYCHSNGGVTVAVQEVDDKMRFGATKCSLVDAYNKKIGRVRALGVSSSSLACVFKKMSSEDMRTIAVSIAKKLEFQNDIALALESV